MTDGGMMEESNGNGATTAAAAAAPLPKCFCNWKNCRNYQKALREYKHPIFNGVVKLKFNRNDPKSMALKAAVDRTLHVDSVKKNDWKPSPQEPIEDHHQNQQPQEEDFTCRYYVARHHFAEALMTEYLADRRSWDWNEPLSMKEAKDYLWILDRQDVYQGDDDDDDDDNNDDDDPRYVQAPNVPKDQVKELIKKSKEEYKKLLAAQEQEKQEAAAAAAAASPRKQADSVHTQHTQSTLSTTITDTLGKAYEDSLLVGGESTSATNGGAVVGTAALAQKEEENTRLRVELSQCQEQLTMLHSMVKQLKVDMDNTRTSDTGNNNGSSKKKKGSKKKPAAVESSSDEEETSEDEDDSSEDEGDWSNGRNPKVAPSDDDETLSTYQVNASHGGSGHSRNARNARKNSIHSRRSIRRDHGAGGSRRNSIHSRSRHSTRRDSIHSRRSIRGGMDDADTVVSRQSLQSVSPSIKSLPREIELMDDEEDTQNDKDEYSFYDDSYRRKEDDDARSVGSRSAASRASRRSIVSRSRARNSRRPTQTNPAPAAAAGAAAPAPTNTKAKGARTGKNAVPREIDLSGDELEDTTFANVSNDTLFVTKKQIVDPYGEKGVYTGALSKSTGMPNGKGRLEYEKEGRWYEGDWIHGRWTGYGRLSNGDGDFYEGGLKNDHKHGNGIMRFADGRVFEGEYIRGQMIQGKMTYQDGSVYGGSWVDGMRHGRGKCIFVDGSEYEGEFREGNFHGQGKMTWNDGGWYVGEWCDGEMHGKGKEIRPDGSLRHDGEWSRGQPIRSAGDARRKKQRDA